MSAGTVGRPMRLRTEPVNEVFSIVAQYAADRTY
jgi:hypothetical protein